MPPAISVENVSKKYRLARSGDERLPYRTLRDDLVRWASWPYRALTGRTSRTEDFWALKDVSFEVQPGEVVGVIGRNGAGKSTLLKVLSRITRPTSGHIRLRGRVGSLLEVGTGFHPELTGRENIYLSGAVLGMKRAEIRRKFDEIVAFAEVEKFLDLPVKRYSSGMYMRLAFAVAAHLEPEILLVDEVLAVGDAAFQKKCLGKMGEVAKGGRTVVFVSHNMGSVVQMCGSAIWMRAGTNFAHGPANEIVSQYLLAQRNDPAEAGSGDLSSRRRTANILERARLQHVQLIHPADASPWSYEFGQPLELLVKVAVATDIEWLQLGIALVSEMGVEFASPLSTDALTPIPIRSGDYRFEVSVHLRLSPGNYTLDFGLRSENGMEDYLPEAIRLDVLPTDESAKLDIQSRRGMVIPTIACDLRPCAA